MKFNKFFIALCAFINIAAVPAFAQSGASLPFIGTGGGGGNPQGFSGNLFLTANATNSYGSSSLIYQKGTFIAYGTATFTNALNPNLTYTNGQLVPVYVTNSSAIADIDLWANRDGTTINGNLSAHIVGINSAFTNTVTLNFATIPASVDLPVTTGTGLFSFALTGNGTNDVVVQTNLITATLQGVRKLRLLSVANTNNGTNGFLVNTWVNGYRAVGQE